MARYPGLTPGMKMDAFVHGLASTLLERVCTQAARAETSGDADSIHDLRVAIRQLQQCLRTFPAFFPAAEVRRIRRKIRAVRIAAGEIRNLDIAAALAEKHSPVPAPDLLEEIAIQRADAAADLNHRLRQWRGRDWAAKWQRDLELA